MEVKQCRVIFELKRYQHFYGESLQKRKGRTNKYSTSGVAEGVPWVRKVSFFTGIFFNLVHIAQLTY